MKRSILALALMIAGTSASAREISHLKLGDYPKVYICENLSTKSTVEFIAGNTEHGKPYIAVSGDTSSDMIGWLLSLTEDGALINMDIMARGGTQFQAGSLVQTKSGLRMSLQGYVYSCK